MQWIYDEFLQDASTHPDIFQAKDPNEEDAFVTRNTSRTLSYINHVCVLEHILIRLYNESIIKLQKIDSGIILNNEGLLTRESEVSDCFVFRNKVSAHTAYGSPRSEDNSAMEFHSLVTLLSTSYDSTGSANSFALGAVSVSLDGQSPSTKLPCLELKELHPKMLRHIEEWTKMFIDPCVEARKKIPVIIDDIEYKIEG